MKKYKVCFYISFIYFILFFVYMFIIYCRFNISNDMLKYIVFSEYFWIFLFWLCLVQRYVNLIVLILVLIFALKEKNRSRQQKRLVMWTIIINIIGLFLWHIMIIALNGV